MGISPTPENRWYLVSNASEVPSPALVVRTSRAESMKTGDVIYAVPWHICPATDRYDTVLVVRGGRVTEQWDVKARKRKITV